MPASPAHARYTWREAIDRIRLMHGYRDNRVWLGPALYEIEKSFEVLIAQAVNAYDALRAAACKDPTLHAVADAPLRPLSDLLRTATEFDEIADDLLVHFHDCADDRTPEAIRRFDALRAAVRALQGPPAPFRPQQAHAAPANGGQS